jgi:hypothetical protein
MAGAFFDLKRLCPPRPATAYTRFPSSCNLEAAEQVRPRRDPTNAKRSRHWRAKKRAEHNVAGDDASNVAGAGRNNNVTAERNVTPPDDDVRATLADARGAMLLTRLHETANAPPRR